MKQILRALSVIAIEVLLLPIRIVVLLVNLVVSVVKHVRGTEKFASYWKDIWNIFVVYNINLNWTFIKTGKFNSEGEAFMEAVKEKYSKDDNVNEDEEVIKDEDIFEDVLGEA